ncbi:hypothetical protein BC629DRAFT_605935 [Irpex lacteus]|nr:hypothetical protein BC629DRAFT_605935 [Irpex lacteus]
MAAYKIRFEDKNNLSGENKIINRKTSDQRQLWTPPPTETTAENGQDDGTAGNHQQAPTLPQAGAVQPNVVAAPPPHVVNPPPQAQPHPPANQPAQAQPAQVQVQWMYGQVGPTTYAWQVPPPPIAYLPGHFQPAPGLGPYIQLDVHDQPRHSLWPQWDQGRLVVIPCPLGALTSDCYYPIYPVRDQFASPTTAQNFAQPNTNDDDAAPVASGSGSGSVSDHDHVPADVAAAAPLSGPSTRDDSPASPVVTATAHEAVPSDDVSDLQQIDRAEAMVQAEEDVAPVASDSGYDSVSEPESVHPAVAPAGLTTASTPSIAYPALPVEETHDAVTTIEQPSMVEGEDDMNRYFDFPRWVQDTAGPAQPASEPLPPSAVVATPETAPAIDPTVVQALPAAPAAEVNAQAAVQAAVQPTTNSRVRRREDDDDDEEEAGERDSQAKRVKLTLAGPVDSEKVHDEDHTDRPVSRAVDEASNATEALEVSSQPATVALEENTSADSERKVDAKADATAVAKDTEKDTTEKAAQVENVVSSDVAAPEAEPKVDEKDAKNDEATKTDVEKKSSDTSTDTPSDKSLDQPASEPAHAETTLPEPKVATAVVKASDKENDTHDVVDPDASKSDADLDKEEKKTPRKAAKKPNSVRRESAPLSPRKQTTPRK